MESTGAADKIQISKSTADNLIVSGKGHWIKPREDAVHAKGLTFWLHIGSKKATSTTSSQEDMTASDGTRSVDVTREANVSNQQQQLVSWIVELLLEHIKNMVSGIHSYLVSII